MVSAAVAVAAAVAAVVAAAPIVSFVIIVDLALTKRARNSLRTFCCNYQVSFR